MVKLFRMRRFLNSMNVFLQFCYYLPLEKGMHLQYEQTLILFTQVCFLPNLVVIGPVVLENKIFKLCQCIFYYLIFISPWKWVGFIIWTNLNPPYPGMLCAKFCWNWNTGSGEKDFLKFVNIFLQFLNYLPLEVSGALHWINLNPLHSKMLCAKFGWSWPTVSGEKFLKKFSMYFGYFIIVSSWKRVRPFIWTNMSPKDALYQVWLKLAH